MLHANGLYGWRVRFNNRLTRTLGQCDYRNRTIEYQPRYMAQNDLEQVKTTIKHEVAHAIAGASAGHGARWARVARELGLENPSATSSTAKLTRKFTGTCGGCGQTWQRDRRAIGAIHPACHNKFRAEVLANGKSDQRFTIDWSRNP